METPYNLSKDYSRLFELICNDVKVPCYVDYRFSNDDKKSSRDICQCKRWNEYDIKIGARGIQYGGVDVWCKDRGTERDLFVQECERMNLEWIDYSSDKIGRYVIGVDPGAGRDFSAIQEIIKKSNGEIIVLSTGVKIDEIAEEIFPKSPDFNTIEFKPLPRLLEPIPVIEKHTHKRKPSKYGKR